MKRVGVYWIREKIVNSTWNLEIDHPFIVKSLNIFTENSLFSRIHYKCTISIADSLWIHYLFREVTMNWLSLSRIKYKYTFFFASPIWIHYTQCSLKLRPVKLLFVIFGRLSYSFFANLMVWGNGRLSYLIWKNHPFFIEKWPIFDRFYAWGGSIGLCYDFWSIRLT